MKLKNPAGKELLPRLVLGASALLGVTALAGCSISIDSYLTDPSNVQCDGKRTKSELTGDGSASFIVHGPKDQLATIIVRRMHDLVSMKVSGDITGPPQKVEPDGFSKPTQIVDGAELSTFGANGAWIIDARQDSIVIQGSCEGM